MELITHSRMDCFKVCRKKHQYAYELGIRSVVDAKALRMGSAYHSGLELLGKDMDLADAVEAARRHYARQPEFMDEYDWNIECETVVRLLFGYQWRWSDDPIRNIASEQSFELPLRNPATGKTTPLFHLAGKIDGIVELQNSGRLAVKESKLLGDDIGEASDLWRRLLIDHQISMYVLAARRLGYAVDCVYYDVTRKPTIGPTAIPLLDELGTKIVLDANGERVKTDRGLWRQTGDRDKGYVLQTRQMTVDEYGEKLNEDIASRPDFYFARREIARLDQDLNEYEEEIWQIKDVIRLAQKNGHWFKTANKNTCGFCNAFSLCTSGWKQGDPLPEGLQFVNDTHPELQREEENVNG